MKGKFKPRNPSKYKGNPTEIIFRSSWELKFMMQLDDNPKVKNWSSEELRIRYSFNDKWHIYYPDFCVTWINNKTTIIEIKPAKQVKAPKVRKKVTRQYITEVMTYGINIAKWKAAKIFAESRGWSFKILTEKELFK